MIKKILLLCSFFLTLSSANFDPQEHFKLYAIYTPSHEFFLNNWFLPTLQDDYELILEKHEQISRSGNFDQEGWRETMLFKVDIVIKGIKENWGKIFIHSDVDIQFFQPTKNIIRWLMQDKDMVIQKDSPNGNMCAGFFALRGNQKNLEIWTKIRKRLSNPEYLEKHPKTNDQVELNRIIRINKEIKIKWAYLPKEFFGGGTLTGKRWKKGLKLPIPKNIVMHHANWTVGVKNKIEQLQYVRDIFVQSITH